MGEIYPMVLYACPDVNLFSGSKSRCYISSRLSYKLDVRHQGIQMIGRRGVAGIGQPASISLPSSPIAMVPG